MLLAHGWAVIQSSREKYKGSSPEDWFVLDDQSNKNDEKLWNDFIKWMNENADPFIVWQLTKRLNNHHGLLQFSISRNHRACVLWDMMSWLARTSESTYGIVYVHDDEDLLENYHYGRGNEDHSNNYRVWRILRGEVHELEDNYLSPIVTRILPNYEA
jgi:hypothetical protein